MRFNMDWYIVPKLIIDRVKYKGKGRPKKEDKEEMYNN